MSAAEHPPSTAARTPCPAPACLPEEIAAYDREAAVGTWAGPRYRMTYRVLGSGPPLVLIPGIAATYRGYALMLNRLAAKYRTVVYDYPGDQPGDGARLGAIGHDDLVDDLFGLLDHLGIGRAFPVGLSFGTTVALRALHREPRRFPKAALQGAFAFRTFTRAERVALRLGRLVPGTARRLPLREAVLSYNSKSEFPAVIADRWPLYLEQNAQTPIRALAHRVALLTRLDLRPALPEIPVETLVLQGKEDRIVPRRYFDDLVARLPNARGVLMPLVGHQPHYTHPEILALAVDQFLLPCAPGGCPNEGGDGQGPDA